MDSAKKIDKAAFLCYYSNIYYNYGFEVSYL